MASLVCLVLLAVVERVAECGFNLGGTAGLSFGRKADGHVTALHRLTHTSQECTAAATKGTNASLQPDLFQARASS